MRRCRTSVPAVAIVALNLFLRASPHGFAQVSAKSAMVPGGIDERQPITISSPVHPIIPPRGDMGLVPDSFAVDRLFLLLNRPPVLDRALNVFLQNLQTPGTPDYHKWVTPEEFGNRFGPSYSDIAAVTAWLESHGLTVNKVHSGHTLIEFTGTAGQIREAFHTQIHQYRTITPLGVPSIRYANDTAPQVPAAFFSLIAGISPLQSVRAKPQVRPLGRANYDLKTHMAKPDWTYPGSTIPSLALAPADFAVQYDLPAASTGLNGTGQSIGILSDSNIDLSLVQAYRVLFGIPASLPVVVIDGNDPGQNSDATEAYLDVELAGSIAPAARVVLYTSAGSILTDPLITSGLRAIEDNNVSVLSLSYALCEPSLGASGNAIISQLWEQAAAQGITVFVAAGDSGAAGCDDPNTETAAYQGFAVNGLASTPYNVAVGGTDFYYSSYAAGATAITNQLATYWNLGSSATPAISLKQFVPEQVWNNAFGLNLDDAGNFANLGYSTILAGSGGASRAAIYPISGVPTGYPKPAWQVAAGVFADKLRDLPDLSLFAGNGANDSYYPICATEGDCVNLASSGAVDITGVGGTSASAPAMAAIQALVNQSTHSAQGQANYVYYALAARAPNTFHDTIVGISETPCYEGTLNCLLGSSGALKGFYLEGGYVTTKGWDAATGLGSVDAANLIKNWSSVAFRPTTTILNISPASFAHGTAVSVSSSVTPTSGTGTATGDLAIESNASVAGSNALTTLTLAAGTVTTNIDTLPGGTYQLTARYEGDGTFAPSTSAPVTVTVAPEDDILQISGWALNPLDNLLYPLQPGLSLPYGTELFLDAQPIGVHESQSTLSTNTPATGSIVFTDKYGTVTRVSSSPLNSVGIAEWPVLGLAPANHTISATYAGDASYAASSFPTAATITIFRGTTSLTVQPLETTVHGGSSVTVDVVLSAYALPFSGTLPTGSLVITLGSQAITAPFKTYGNSGQYLEEAIVTFTNVPVGLLPLSATYGGDTNWLGSSSIYGTILSLAQQPAPIVTLTAPVTSFVVGQTVTLSGTVTGKLGLPIPSGFIYLTSQDGLVNYTVPLVPGTSAASYTYSFPSALLVNGSNNFIATFKGDANYSAQSSAPLTLSLNGADFSLTTLSAEVADPLGKPVSGSVTLAPINGFTGAVTISCTAPTGITCKPTLTSITLGSGGYDPITYTSLSNMAPGTYPTLITASGGGRIHTAQILVSVY